MNKHLTLLGFTALMLTACNPLAGSDKLTAEDFEDFFEDYVDWKIDQDNVEIDPFKAKPIFVTGTGTVRATPDIAVLTGMIRTEATHHHKAVNEAAEIINRVQDIIKDKDIDLSFTTLSSAEQRDENCLAHNREAARRHSDIQSDNWFNTRERNRPEDVRQKLRPAKARMAQKLCEVTHVENYIGFTAWVRPSAEVSEYIRAFTEAGVENVNLFGFDFSNYDALYKEAAEKAVENARQKAEISARIAGTTLTTVESFSVTGTERRRRYGQQATIISPHGNRSVTPQQRISFSDRVIRSQATPRRGRNTPQYVAPAPVANFTCWDGSMVFGAGQCPVQPAMQGVSDSYSASTYSASASMGGGFTSSGPIFETISEPIVIQEASTELVTIPATYETVMDTIVVQPASGGLPAVTQQVPRRVVKTPASTTERTIPAVTKMVTRRVLKNPGASGGGVTTQSGASNALNESLLSGSKTIRVSATLSYNYETPLDGVIFKTEEAN